MTVTAHRSGPQGTGGARLSDHEAGELWRRRVFEAVAGLSRYLADRGESAPIADWIALQSEIFAAVPAGPGPAADWQKLFFHAQALMERFLVARYGHAALTGWAASNAEVHRTVEPNPGGGAADPITRVARQAELYGSRYRLTPGPVEASLVIEHCAIWDYRERARARGVPITLTSPCQYCTQATAANIAAKGYRPAHELFTTDDGHGCRWDAAEPHRIGGDADVRRDRLA